MVETIFSFCCGASVLFFGAVFIYYFSGRSNIDWDEVERFQDGTIRKAVWRKKERI